MCTFIGMDDLIANALIELIDNRDIETVSFDTIVKYGTVVASHLKSNNNEVALLISKEYKHKALSDNSEFFELSVRDDNEFVNLRNGKSVMDLKKHFRTFLSTDLLSAFLSDDAYNILAEG